MNYNKAEFVTSYGLFSQIPKAEKMEIAFAGRSNVGKSSMLNKLFRRKNLARVSSVPGKTATINFYEVDHVYFVDLPGYGYAKVSKSEKKRWSQLIEGYFNSDRDLGLVVQLIDIRHKPSALDVQMIDFLIDAEIPFIILLTKSDKLGVNALKKRLEEIKTEIPCADQVKIIPFSTQTGIGEDELKEILDEVCEEKEDLSE